MIRERPRDVGGMRFVVIPDVVERDVEIESWDLGSFIVNNVGEDCGHINQDIDPEFLAVLDALLALEVGETFTHDGGAGGVTKYRRVR